MKKYALTLIALFAALFMAEAQEIVVIAKETPITEKPSKAATIMNQFDEPVVALPGMVFEKVKATQSYISIKAFEIGFPTVWISKTSASSTCQPITSAAGTYEDNGAEIVVKTNGNGEYVIDDLTGKQIGNAIVFINSDGDMVYSIAKTGGKLYVYSYSNDIRCWR